MNRSKKEQIVAELQEKLKDVKLAILADYSGLNVEKITDLRNELRKSDAEFRVIKNTLFRIASKDTDFRLFDDYLKGPLALIMNFGDVVESTKTLVNFARKNEELELKAGVFDNRFLTNEQIKTLSELPSREVLLGKLLSMMVAAQTSLVTVLSGVPRKFVQTLEAYRVKKEKEN
ncbi:MAG: 50S ribosomal protein L10 [Syntrophobacterales bacterium]|nr:50S ribosomal protein L10 [Syntrophobacterales bacterium]